MKLCASYEKTPANTEDIFCIAYAQMKFLQEEYAALVVNSSFDPNVAKLFRALQKNSGFSQETMEQLKNAATIASAYRPPSQANRGRGGRGRGVFRNNERELEVHVSKAWWRSRRWRQPGTARIRSRIASHSLSPYPFHSA